MPRLCVRRKNQKRPKVLTSNASTQKNQPAIVSFSPRAMSSVSSARHLLCTIICAPPSSAEGIEYRIGRSTSRS